MIAVSLLLVFLPIAMTGTVLAQTTGYTITQVDHQIQVLYTGQVVVQDTIQVSGQVTDGFMIGLPAQYSNDILSAVAYDSNSVFQVNLGVQLGSRSGFYGAKVNFNGQTPSVFTIAFVLSNSLIAQKDTGDFTLSFPAYPSLTQDVGSCNVTLTFPSTPRIITITKSDGDVDTENYATQNLPAYTYSIGLATVQVANGTIQLADITQLNRQITIGPTGQVSASDTYTIINNSTYTMANFILDVPASASNVVVKDETGAALSIESSLASTNVLQENATLVTPSSTGQSTILMADYNLPGATIQGSQYTLSNFKLFPDIKYYVDQASLTFNPPEGAKIITPKLSSLDMSSTLTRNAFQDTLTIIRDGISNLDYSLPQSNTIQISYTYNPVWVSFMPTLWLSLVAVIGCVGAVIYQNRKPGEKERAVTRKATVSTPKPTSVASTEQVKSGEPGAVTPISQRITGESIREFTESYEDKKRLNAELRSLDVRAQKGKIPRRQYKVQRRAIEVRLETISRNTNRMKETLRSSGSAYLDIVKQLDSVEEDLAETENNIKNLEDQQSRGEISIEAYKRTIEGYQKRRDKAESTLNGILLRLREKAR